jgi:hypothetical protein
MLAGVIAAAAFTTAHAYRPFDSTDADVARAGEFELELGPAGRLREGARKFLVAPAAIANIGLPGDRELVIEGRRELASNPAPGQPRSVLEDNGVFIKQLLRRGALQDGAGPSLATEYGLLLPSIPGHGTGFSVAGIASERAAIGALHLNAAIARTREHEADVFLGAIVEGPARWAVRPVAEVFAERSAGGGTIRSRLVGAIWRARDGLSFDIGVRHAQAGAEPIHELRLGLTWAFSFERE